MSIVKIFCPHCGSTVTEEIEHDQYICKSCSTKFNYARPQDGVVVSDVKTHNCPICGRYVKGGEGNRCTRCKSNDVCPECVQVVDRMLICRTCITNAKEECMVCGNYATLVCPSCEGLKKKKISVEPTQICDKHGTVEQTILTDDWLYLSKPGRKNYTYNTFVCKTCGGAVCYKCVVSESGFRSKQYCKNCSTRLEKSPSYKMKYPLRPEDKR